MINNGDEFFKTTSAQKTPGFILNPPENARAAKIIIRRGYFPATARIKFVDGFDEYDAYPTDDGWKLMVITKSIRRIKGTYEHTTPHH